MAAPETQTCPWDVTYADCDGTCDAYTAFEDPEKAKELYEAIASDLLWNWTGRVFGTCEVSVRPCQSGCADSGWSTYWGRGPLWDPGFPSHGTGPHGGASWYPVLVSGRWYNVTCGCAGVCTCAVTGPTVLSLPGPIQSVTEVWIDGVVLPPTSYRVQNKRYLIRTDGEAWPQCQNMLADPTTDKDTFEVTYVKGLPVPIGGQVAAGRLACELALAACGSAECALPERVTTITRQGVTVGFADTYEDLKAGGTGIYSIDTWVASVTRSNSFASVRSYDTR